MADNYSFEEIRDKIRASVNAKYSTDPMKPVDLWPTNTKPTAPITDGTTIIEDYRNDKFYQIPFTVNNNGDVELGDAVEVQHQDVYTAVKASDLIVFKDEAQRVVTTPVLVPYCDDCDAKRGEKQLTPDEIQFMMYEYMQHHQIVDKYHDYFFTEKNVADTVEIWQLREPVISKNVTGEFVSLPTGTWMQSFKVTDEETWQEVDKGVLKGASVTALSKETADQLAAAKGISTKERVLIKDLTDPVGYTVSLVPNPCVEAAIFTSVKSCPTGKKAGRSISNATLDPLKKAYDAAQNSLDQLKNLLDKAMGERNPNPTTMEVDKMDENDVKKMVDEKVDEKVNEATKDLKEENQSLKQELEDLKQDRNAIKCTKCNHDLGEANKFCPQCGDKIEEETGEPDDMEALKTKIENHDKELKSLKEQVNKSNDLTGGSTGGTPPIVNKRDDRGVPIEKTW